MTLFCWSEIIAMVKRRSSGNSSSPSAAKKSRKSKKNGEKNFWLPVSCLAGKAKTHLRDFVVPEEYLSEGETQATKSDKQFLSLRKRDRLVISTDMLSKDVAELPKDFKKIKLKVREMEYLPMGNRGTFFHISQMDLKKKAKAHYHSLCSSNQLKHMGTSQIFQKHGYCKAYNPKIRYHFNLNSLIDSYKEVSKIKEVEFRKFETVRYPKEWMFVVLVCPQKSKELKEFPLIEVGRKDWETDQVIRITKQLVEDDDESSDSDDSDSDDSDASSDSGAKFNIIKRYKYRLHWKPFCTRKRNSKWDHVTFLFYFPAKKGKNGFPLSKSCKYQLMKRSGYFGHVKCLKK